MRNLILVVLMLGALTLTNCGKETIIERIEVQKGSQILSGSGKPAPSLGSVGDYYLDITTTQLYGAKTENGWGTPINLKGLQGERGAKGDKGEKGETGRQGEKGDKGDNGSDGSNGVAGRDGTKIFSGNTTPDNSLGSVGDFYIDLTEKKLYGPKTDSGWGSVISLVSNITSSSYFLTKTEVVIQANTTFEKYFVNGATIIQTDESKRIANVSFEDNKYNKQLIIKGLVVGETELVIENETYKQREEIKVKIIENTGDYLLSDNCQKLHKWLNTQVTEIDMRNDPILKNIKVIGSNVFDFEEKNRLVLTSVILPDNLKEIENTAFYNCRYIEQIQIPNSVTEIGYNAFSGCKSLKSIVIPTGVKVLSSSMFSDCISLSSVSLPNTLTEIGSGVFSNCTSLTTITIPNGVTKIGSSVFSNCTSLQPITIPNSVIEIGSNAFSSCSSMTSISIPNGVKKIGSGAFSSTPITSIEIPYGVTHISSNTFSNCQSLTNVILPNSINTIDDRAFSDCTSLETITIPSGIKGLGEYIFSNCQNLRSLKVEAVIPPKLIQDNNMFFSYRFTSVPNIYVPAGSVEAYKNAEGWKEYASKIKPIQ